MDIAKETSEQQIARDRVREGPGANQFDDLRETFLTMLGHELQTPIAIIKGFAGTLARRADEREDKVLSQGLKVIEEESDRLSRMVEKLLFASRISTGTSALAKEPVHFPTLVRSVIRRLKPLATAHTFDIRFPRGFPAVVADAGLMEQVLSNLLENAIKYSPQGGRISVSGSKSDQFAVISVTDEGVGISAEKMEHLFERFQAVEDQTPRVAKGMGLGLYICKSILEAHHGSIEAVSQPGRGSCFTFRLLAEEGHGH
jgi:signal transduction histidine kinase